MRLVVAMYSHFKAFETQIKVSFIAEGAFINTEEIWSLQKLQH